MFVHLGRIVTKMFFIKKVALEIESSRPKPCPQTVNRLSADYTINESYFRHKFSNMGALIGY